MLEKIKTIWKNKALIWEGLINKIFKRDPVEKVYNERIKICKECPNLDNTGTKCMVVGTQPCCGICGCSLSMKLRSMDSQCPHPDGPKWDIADM
jgi:hypothetical protein